MCVYIYIYIHTIKYIYIYIYMIIYNMRWLNKAMQTNISTTL